MYGRAAPSLALARIRARTYTRAHKFARAYRFARAHGGVRNSTDALARTHARTHAHPLSLTHACAYTHAHARTRAHLHTLCGSLWPSSPLSRAHRYQRNPPVHSALSLVMDYGREPDCVPGSPLVTPAGASTLAPPAVGAGALPR